MSPPPRIGNINPDSADSLDPAKILPSAVSGHGQTYNNYYNASPTVTNQPRRGVRKTHSGHVAQVCRRGRTGMSCSEVVASKPAANVGRRRGYSLVVGEAPLNGCQQFHRIERAAWIFFVLEERIGLQTIRKAALYAIGQLTKVRGIVA